MHSSSPCLVSLLLDIWDLLLLRSILFHFYSCSCRNFWSLNCMYVAFDFIICLNSHNISLFSILTYIFVVRNFPQGQEAIMEKGFGNLILELLPDNHGFMPSKLQGLEKGGNLT